MSPGSGSPRRLAIGAENGAEVLFAVDRQSMHISSSTLRIAQRRTFDVDGVAVVAEPAEQRFDHGLIAKEVVPLIILEIGSDDRGVAITQIEILVLLQRRRTSARDTDLQTA